MTSNGEVGLIDKYCVGKNRQAGVAEVPGIFLANGAGAMAIYTVCLSCLLLLTLVMGGCQGAMVPVLVMLVGEKDYLGVRMLMRYVMRFSLSLAGTLVLLLLIFPQAVLALFNMPASLYADGAEAIRLFSVSILGVTFTFLLMYYYMTIGQKTAANLLSWVEGILVVAPAAWLLVRYLGLTGVWLAFILAELAGFAVLYIYIARVKARRSLPDFFLIPDKPRHILYDVSVSATKENAVALSKGAIAALESSGLARDISLKAGLALEEMAATFCERESGKESDIDIRISQTGTGIVIALRDNGAPFNPVEYTSEDKLTDGILVLKAMAKDIKYSRVLALNQTLIEL